MLPTPSRTNTNAGGRLPSWDRAYRRGLVARIVLAAALPTLLTALATPAQQPAQRPAQQPAQESPAARAGPVLTLQNLAPFARREGAAVVVPFA
jgi:hypothetical protein